MDLSHILNQNQEQEAPQALTPENKAVVLTTLATKPEEKKYQHYASSRISMRLITLKGKKITFTNHQFITDDKDIIEYLDTEISNGLNVITKGKLMTHSESDPMAILRKKHFEEFQKEQDELAKKAALGIQDDMGGAKTPEQIAAGAKPVSTSQVTNAAGSSS